MRASMQSDPSTARSMLKRLFDRQFLRISPAERLPSTASPEKDEAESVCLDGMVRSFLEEDGAVAPADRARHGGRYCNCFHGGGDNSDDEEEDDEASSDAAETIKGLVHCATLRERNLLADACFHLERHRAAGARRRVLLRLAAASLRAGGRDAAVCVSRWDKSPSHPSSEHGYLDVLLPAASDRSACWWTPTSGPRSRWRGPPRRTARCCSACRRCSSARRTASACRPGASPSTCAPSGCPPTTARRRRRRPMRSMGREPPPRDERLLLLV